MTNIMMMGTMVVVEVEEEVCLSLNSPLYIIVCTCLLTYYDVTRKCPQEKEERNMMMIDMAEEEEVSVHH